MNDTTDHVFAHVAGPGAGETNSTGRRSADWLRAGAMVLIALLLGGVAWAGHASGWKVPKLSAIFGGANGAKDDWCKDHGVPESQCVECDRKLAPWIKHYGWCEKHGVHNCPLDYPDAAQVMEATVSQADKDRAARVLGFKNWPENNAECLKVHRILQFASQDAFQKMNVAFAKVGERPLTETVTANGELQFMPKAVAAASCSVSGRIWQVTAKGKLGGTVSKGDVLAIVDAADVGKARAELLQAYAQFHSRKQLLDSSKAAATQGAMPAFRLMELEAAFDEAVIRFKAAQQALINLGLPIDEAQILGLSPAKLADELPRMGLPPDMAKMYSSGKLTANLLPVRAPRDGIVTEVKVNDGETIEASKTLFVVADTSKLWLLLNVRQEDARFLKVQENHKDEPNVIEGSTVKFKSAGHAGEFHGTLVWKGISADEKTRAIQFAAEVPNDKQLLAAHSFVSAKIVIREEKSAMVVPSDAVHWEGDCNVVFVLDKHWFQPGALKLVHIRSVRPGVSAGGETEIIAGLLPGEFVATTNSAVLRAELLKTISAPAEAAAISCPVGLQRLRIRVWLKD